MSDSLEGSEFAGYRVGRLVGRGGMGVVYLARDAAMGRTVALKLIVPALAEDESFRARFERESRLAAAIDHPNALPIYEAGSSDGSLFIAMRFVEGTDLRKLIKLYSGLEPRRAARMVAGVASALDAAHGHGLVHRDVKPANVLVAADDHVYLTDFGLTRRADASGLTQAGHFVGTLDYASPEHLRGAPVTRAADIYALGCVLYEALTGFVPFPRESEGAKVYAHINVPSPVASALAPDVPPELDRVVTRALAKQPEQRFQSAGELGAAAIAAASGQPWEADAGGRADSGAVTIPPREVADAEGPEAPERAGATAPAAERLKPGARVLLFGGVAVLAVAGLVFALVRDGASSPTEIAFPGRPGEVATGAGTVWVIDEQNSELVRIDSASRAITGAPISVPARPNDVAVGDGNVWVASSDGTLSRIAEDDPSHSDQLSVGGEPFAVALGPDSVWVADREGDRIIRVDAQRMRVTGVTRMGANPFDLAIGAEGLWVGLPDGAQRLDPDSGDRQGDIIRTPGPLESIAVGEGAVWATSQSAGSAVRIDPQSGKVSAPIEAGTEPEGLAIGEGSAWVTAQRDDDVLRFDTNSGEHEGGPIGVGSDPGGIAVGDGAVWVANYYGGSVTRIEP